MKTNASNDLLSAIDRSKLSAEDPSGNSGFSNIASLDSQTDFMSLIHQINMNNSGNINVSFQLK